MKNLLYLFVLILLISCSNSSGPDIDQGFQDRKIEGTFWTQVAPTEANWDGDPLAVQAKSALPTNSVAITDTTDDVYPDTLEFNVPEDLGADLIYGDSRLKLSVSDSTLTDDYFNSIGVRDDYDVIISQVDDRNTGFFTNYAPQNYAIVSIDYSFACDSLNFEPINDEYFEYKVRAEKYRNTDSSYTYIHRVARIKVGDIEQVGLQICSD